MLYEFIKIIHVSNVPGPYDEGPREKYVPMSRDLI